MRQRKHPNFHRHLALLLTLALCLTLAASALAAQDTTASSIQLAKTEGTVSATNSAGRNISLIKNLRLFSGYHVTTAAKSYAWLNLDSAKLLKEDASSETEVRKSGKKLEVLLSSGSLFFNVTEPLEDDETMNIRTSTTLTGVRGTCGWVEVIDRWNTRVSILEGTVECVVSDPVSGERKSTTINAGETATFVVYPNGTSSQAGEQCEIVTERIAVGDVPGYVLVELAQDRSLCSEIRDASGLDILGSLTQNGSAAAGAQRRLEEDEAEAASRLAVITAREEAQANNTESAPAPLAEDGRWKDILGSIPYYGDVENCAMTADQALAYAQLLADGIMGKVSEGTASSSAADYGSTPFWDTPFTVYGYSGQYQTDRANVILGDFAGDGQPYICVLSSDHPDCGFDIYYSDGGAARFAYGAETYQSRWYATFFLDTDGKMTISEYGSGGANSHSDERLILANGEAKTLHSWNEDYDYSTGLWHITEDGVESVYTTEEYQNVERVSWEELTDTEFHPIPLRDMITYLNEYAAARGSDRAVTVE